MPTIFYQAAQLSKDEKRELVVALTEAAAKVTKRPIENFTVYIDEHPLDNIGIGGKLLSERNK